MDNPIVMFLVASVFLFIYFFPYLMARDRQHPHRGGILIVNLFFGLTFVGWVLCLAWACSVRPTYEREPKPKLVKRKPEQPSMLPPKPPPPSWKEATR